MENICICSFVKLNDIISDIKVNFDLWGYFHYHHWIVGNIPGCNMAKGEELIPYVPPIGQHGLCTYFIHRIL